MKQLFDSYDTDSSGCLDRSEVVQALRRAGKQASDVQLDQLFEAADANGDGTIDFEEFQILMSIPEREEGSALIRAALAEFLGVMLFQFFGGLKTAGAAGNGVILAVLIYNTAAISGGHLNPAVTFALALTQQIPPLKMVVYWCAQLMGGIVGAAMYAGLEPNKLYYGQNLYLNSRSGCTVPCGGTATGIGELASGGVGNGCNLTAGHIFGIEFLATFVLVFTVFGTAVDPKTGAGNFAPIAIGFSLFACATCIGGLSGAGLNPARSLTPAIVFDCWTINGNDSFQWMYPIAQLIGGAAAGLIYKYVFLSRPDDGKAKSAGNAFRFVSTEMSHQKAELAKKSAVEKQD